MAGKVPVTDQPGVATQIPIQKINVSAGENNRRNEEPAWEKEPKRQRPGKILERKAVAQCEHHDVNAGNGGAKFGHAAHGMAQPGDHECKRRRDYPTIRQKKYDGPV